MLKQDNFRIIYLDESIFTTKTIQKSDYSPHKIHHVIPQAQVNQPVYVLILAISEENGLEHYQIFEKSVNAQKFKKYLLSLRRANEFQRMAIFMDNLQVHKTNAIKKVLKSQNIQAIYNVPYSPDFNPCECCFAKIKNIYKRSKMSSLVNGEIVDFENLVKASVESIEKADVVNSVKWSLGLINQ